MENELEDALVAEGEAIIEADEAAITVDPAELVALSTPLLFDIGVYFVVVGTITSIALALEERERD